MVHVVSLPSQPLDVSFRNGQILAAGFATGHAPIAGFEDSTNPGGYTGVFDMRVPGTNSGSGGGHHSAAFTPEAAGATNPLHGVQGVGGYQPLVSEAKAVQRGPPGTRVAWNGDHVVTTICGEVVNFWDIRGGSGRILSEGKLDDRGKTK